MTKSFIWIMVILIILAGVIWWFGLFDKINTFSFNSAESLSSLKNLNSLNSLKVAEKFNEPIVNKISELPKKIIASAVEKFKESLIGSAKNEVGQVIDSFQQNLGLRVSDIVNEKPFTISLSSNSNTPVYFLIDGADSEGAFVIDWGDSGQTRGEIEPNKKKIINHAWREIGIYLVNALISNKNNEARRFSFPIYIQ